MSLGLLYLHLKDIIHGDLKGVKFFIRCTFIKLKTAPQGNILIDDNEKAVLCDFGLSRVKEDVNSRSIQIDIEDVRGSLNWMAPERLQKRPLRKPCDIYSFGMTIYEVNGSQYKQSPLN